MLAADGGLQTSQACDLIVPYCTCSEHLPGDSDQSEHERVS